ncbi:MAG: hypothetical protein BLM47_10840 [Candidatus Reconcilbacillus cellulovorans]|uniref:Nucleotidyltransferase n=1 Tax=Candidatus Reconcilbacillus cellulovorans TaxID=1906605 RepID=A0A2A6DYK1_9BACL|nr:MAG: hypothetical protein BLM47_10840 [Candidatus Reconcilbacillus cellulovorans]
MFWDILDGTRISVLKQSARLPVPGTYLAGGTALALQLGHRDSEDFDFFTPEPFDPDDVIAAWSELGELLVTDSRPGTVHGLLNGVRVTLIRYAAPMLGEWLTDDRIPGLRIASALDIALMKVIALSQRGAKKDFIDLYAIHHSVCPLDGVIDRLPEKFPGKRINYYHILKSFVYFDDAEQEPTPNIRTSWTWDDVKSFFKRIQPVLLHRLEDSDR